MTRNNLDGSTSVYGGGSSNISPASNSVTLAGSTNQVSATVTAKRGAVGYAWFFGTSAATATLVAITTVNAVSLTSTAGAGTQTASNISADNSQNALVFDGLLTYAGTPANNSYYKTMDNTPLTSDSAAGINEIDAALQSLYDNYRLEPNVILVSSQEARNINKKVIANSGAPGRKSESAPSAPSVEPPPLPRRSRTTPASLRAVRSRSAPAASRWS